MHGLVLEFIFRREVVIGVVVSPFDRYVRFRFLGCDGLRVLVGARVPDLHDELGCICGKLVGSSY